MRVENQTKLESEKTCVYAQKPRLKMPFQNPSLKGPLTCQHIVLSAASKSSFICGSPRDFEQARKSYWSWNNEPIGIKSSSYELIGNKEGQ
jgi:hypothetical protein